MGVFSCADCSSGLAGGLGTGAHPKPAGTPALRPFAGSGVQKAGRLINGKHLSPALSPLSPPSNPQISNLHRRVILLHGHDRKRTRPESKPTTQLAEVNRPRHRRDPGSLADSSSLEHCPRFYPAPSEFAIQLDCPRDHCHDCVGPLAFVGEKVTFASIAVAQTHRATAAPHLRRHRAGLRCGRGVLLYCRLHPGSGTAGASPSWD